MYQWMILSFFPRVNSQAKCLLELDLFTRLVYCVPLVDCLLGSVAYRSLVILSQELAFFCLILFDCVDVILCFLIGYTALLLALLLSFACCILSVQQWPVHSVFFFHQAT